LSHPELEHVVLRAEESGRALARIAVDLKECGPQTYRELFDGLAAAASTWSTVPVPIHTPYYALVAGAYRDEVARLLGLSCPSRGADT
jgi:hypothetical protein